MAAQVECGHTLGDDVAVADAVAAVESPSLCCLRPISVHIYR